MEKYEVLKVANVSNLKKSTIYFFLKNAGFSENYIKNLRNSSSAILLNNAVSTINQKIEIGDEIKISKSPNTRSKIPECDGNLEVLYEDEDYLIVNKPHNLACIPTRKHITNNLGGQIVKYMLTKDENFVLRIVNRLDRETAGIVIIAKNVSAFNQIDAIKTYYALCDGNVKKMSFTIDKPIQTVVENGINKMKREISSDGKRAITHVLVEKNFDGFCLVKFNLETGRTHQIRVHMASIGHHLIGDLIYSPTKQKDESHTYLLLKEVSFKHFRTSKDICLSVDFPKEWEKFLK